MKQQPKAPGHLRAETARWWLSVVAEYDLEPHHIRLLTLAAEAWDRAHEARVALHREGLTYEDRFGAPKARPEVAIERDSRIGFARLLRELALDVNAPADDSRPPQIRPQAHLRAG
jgi:phage terminase small subunit